MTEIIEAAVARIETKLDRAIEDRADHEKRLRSLERERWVQRGGLGVITFILARLHLG